MCDITESFNQVVIKLRENSSIKNFPVTKRGTKYIKTNSIQKDLITKIKDVLSAITKIKVLLLKNQKDYLNLYSALEQTSFLNDDDRNKIDNIVESFVKNYTNIITQLKLESCTKKELTEQMKQHFNFVICFVEDYLRHVFNIYSEQKKIRIKRTLNRNKVSKLENFHKNSNNLSNEEIQNKLRKRKNIKDEDNLNENEILIHQEENYKDQEILKDLTKEELQIFEKENDQLFDDLNLLNEEVRKIEGQVVEIAQLQELFTEKVLQQEQELNKVSLAFIGSTEDIKGGNDELRNAMKKNAGFRIWILFFIIILSFTILFLDWYNP